MNWGRIRWLLIVCLVFADVILGVMLYRQYRDENVISRTAAADVAVLLADSGIEIDVDTIPTRIYKDYVFSIPVSEDSYRQALARLTDSAISGTYMLPSANGMSVVFENGDRAEYYKNLYFTYIKNGCDAENMIAERFLSGDRDGFVVADGDSAAASAEETALLFLSGMTASSDEGNVHLRPRLTECLYRPSEDIYCLFFGEEIARGNARNATDIYGTGVCVVVKDDTVCCLHGTWVHCFPSEVYRTQKLDQINILFSEKQRYAKQQSLGDSAQPLTARTIDTMERTYYMLWDDNGTLYVRPAWRFVYRVDNGGTSSVGEEILCDAVTGNVVVQTDAS